MKGAKALQKILNEFSMKVALLIEIVAFVLLRKPMNTKSTNSQHYGKQRIKKEGVHTYLRMAVWRSYDSVMTLVKQGFFWVD